MKNVTTLFASLSIAVLMGCSTRPTTSAAQYTNVGTLAGFDTAGAREEVEADSHA